MVLRPIDQYRRTGRSDASSAVAIFRDIHRGSSGHAGMASQPSEIDLPQSILCSAHDSPMDADLSGESYARFLLLCERER